MIQRERHFEYLVALAVAGQISTPELEELDDHMADCSSCSQRMAEMESTNLQLFLTLAAQIDEPRISSRLQEEFRVRAEYAGIPLTRPSSEFRHSNFLHFAALVVAVCLLVGMGWKQVTHGYLSQAIGSASSTKIAAPRKPSFKADPDSPMLLKAVVAQPPTNGPRRRNRHTAGNAESLPSFAMNQETRVARPLFSLDSALLRSRPRAIDTDSKPSHLQDVSSNYLNLRGADLAPRFGAPTIWNSVTDSVPTQRVFHYSATLASISVQDDQAVFGLKPRVRDLSFSDTLGSIRLR